MNLTIRLNRDLVERLNAARRETGEKRDTLICEAITEWLDRRGRKKWPPAVMNFRGIRGFKGFETNRCG